jgi:hypothetical protein
MTRISRDRLLLGIEGLSIAVFIWRGIIFIPGRPSGVPPALIWLSLAGIGLALVFALLGGVNQVARLLARRTRREVEGLKSSITLSLAPVLLFGPFILARHFYPLNKIENALIVVPISGCAFLLFVFLARVEWVLPEAGARKRMRNWLECGGAATRKTVLSIFLITLAIYVIYAAGIIFPAQPFTGDEPHYVLIARSLFSDGDINLANNYQNRDYEAFYPGTLDPHAAPGKKGGHFLYSRHFPGLPMLIVPFYAVGAKTAGVALEMAHRAADAERVLVFFSRLPLCIMAAVLSLVLFLFVGELTRRRRIALLSWVIFSFISPLLFYSHLVYPEIPVALILLAISFAVILKKDLSPKAVFWTGLGVGLLPWFGIKYIVPALTIFLLVLYLFLNSAQKSLKAGLALFSSPFVSAILYVIFLRTMYGTLSPTIIYMGADESQTLPLSRFLAMGIPDFFGRLFGLLFDQRTGIWIFCPIFILSLAGILKQRKSMPLEARLLLVLFVVYWIFCSITRYWGGYCPPGRPLLPVFWILAVFLASAFGRQQNRAFRAIAGILLLLSAIIILHSLPNPRLLYNESLSSVSSPDFEEPGKFLADASNLAVDWTRLVPSLSSRAHPPGEWIPLSMWILLAFGMNWLAIKKSRGEEGRENRLAFSHLAIIVLIISLAALTYLNFDVRLENGFATPDCGLEVFPQDANNFGIEEGGFWVKGDSSTFVIVRTAERIAEFQVTLSTPVSGRGAVKLGGLERDVEWTEYDGREQTVTFRAPRSFPWKGGLLYALEVEVESGFYPYRIERDSMDKRYLGVFVRLTPSF